MKTDHSNQRTYKLVALITLTLSFFSLSFAQSQETVTLEGRIVDNTGQAVSGAAVYVKDAPEKGNVITDIDGLFYITVPKGSVLNLQCLGYTDSEYTASASAKNLTLVMESTALALDDVVVVAYGTQKKESVVGAISQIRGDALAETGNINVTNALTGKFSGVTTMQSSGQPGNNDSDIFIRGVSSWNGSKPLIMVDGIERPFNELNPNEIETISVLKDASATAMFGAKGANGVILVTTKSGVEGKPKLTLNASYGIDLPTNLPAHVSSYETAKALNVAFKNGQAFGSQFSDRIIGEYRAPSSAVNSIRYPDVDWYELTMKDFASSANATLSISGGTKKVKYYLMAGYSHEGSLFKNLSEVSKCRFQYDRINFRSNIDANITKSTKLSFKLGGYVGNQTLPTGTSSLNSLFRYIFSSSGMMYSPYYPSWVLEQIEDTDYPDATGDRITSKKASTSYYDNAYRFLAGGEYQQTTKTNLNADFVLRQNLDFITKGLSIRGTASLTTLFTRLSENYVQPDLAVYYIDWDRYDNNDGNPWVNTNASNNTEVFEGGLPYLNNRSTLDVFRYTLYFEGAVDYNRTWKDHNVTALALYSQRDYVGGTDFPYRYQSLVGRVTYDYNHMVLVEANLGYTGSEQFSPKNRFGLFPSVAVGYVPSQHKFWKRAMPWWNKLKIRYSDGLVGSDAASERWLYYSTFVKEGDYIYEGEAANSTAKWETAHKRDIGIEMGFLNNDITLNIDLWDEQRKDMLVTPNVNMLVGAVYKDINRGSMKKHGVDIEIGYKHKTSYGFRYNVTAMVGLNENRITNYEDAPYSPDYQKYAGTPYQAQRNGIEIIDGGYFTSVDDIHAYPSFSADWGNVPLGAYKFLDYNGDGQLTSNDLHCIAGSSYPPLTYSLSGGLSYKGWDLSMTFNGVHGKWIDFNSSWNVEFEKGDYLIREQQLDYWRPDNQTATHPTLVYGGSSGHMMYTWAGGSAGGRYTAMIKDHTWRKSNYFMLKDLYLAYTFSFRKSSGIRSLTLNFTGNNIFTVSDLKYGDPQKTSLTGGYYPIMRTFKLGFKMGF